MATALLLLLVLLMMVPLLLPAPPPPVATSAILASAAETNAVGRRQRPPAATHLLVCETSWTRRPRKRDERWQQVPATTSANRWAAAKQRADAPCSRQVLCALVSVTVARKRHIDTNREGLPAAATWLPFRRAACVCYTRILQAMAIDSMQSGIHSTQLITKRR